MHISLNTPSGLISKYSLAADPGYNVRLGADGRRGVMGHPMSLGGPGQSPQIVQPYSL